MSAEPPAVPTHQAGANFIATPWTVILEARSDPNRRRAALERLCRSYWPPVYHYIRRRGHAPHDAEDLTQGFFAYVLESDFLDRPDPAKGRFRGYLVGALKRFLSDEFAKSRAQKRGGGAEFLDWQSAAAEQELTLAATPNVDPSEAYEKSWALTLLARALERLAAEQSVAGRAAAFQQLRPHLTQPAAPGDYARLALALGLTRAGVALAVHRLNLRYAELVRLEVAATVTDPTAVRTEMEHLLLALRR